MSSLTVDPQIPLEDGLALYDQRAQAALQALQQSGFYMPHEPYYADARGQNTPYRGELPPDLTVITDQQLGWYLTMLSNWLAYVQVKLAEADLNRTTAKDKIEFLEAKLKAKMIENKGEGKKKLSNPEVDAVVKCDQRYVTLKTNLNYFEAIYKMVRAVAHSAENAWDTVSRRITQRQQEIERDRRSGSVGNSALPSGPMFAPRRLT